jgi:uncharacterized membrane protein
MSEYQNTADIFLQIGPIISCAVVCILLIVVISIFSFWCLCLIHAFRNDIKDRNLWITILLVSFFLPGFVWAVIASTIYYYVHKPKLSEILKKDTK